jgi:hypothetical protein
LFRLVPVKHCNIPLVENQNLGAAPKMASFPDVWRLFHSSVIKLLHRRRGAIETVPNQLKMLAAFNFVSLWT